MAPPSAEEADGRTPLRNALDPELLEQLASRQLVFFLDYDGTLAPIVNEPERAFISEETREAVRALAASYPVGLVSGRSNEKLRGFLKIGGVYLAGSHGVDIIGPDGKALDGPDPVTRVGAGALEALKAAHVALDAELADVAGYLTEDNVYCISAHYRQVDPSKHQRVRDATLRVLKDQPLLRHKEGKMVHELRPAVDWDKGKAVEWLLHLLKVCAPAMSLFPVYLGDDVADEDAFRAVKRLDGVGIKVAHGSVPQASTAATWSLEQPEVVRFLQSFGGGAAATTEGEQPSAAAAADAR